MPVPVTNTRPYQHPESPQGWAGRFTSPIAAGLLLVLFWLACVHGVSNESLTSDESVHAYAGYTYWKDNDYRINPENGNLPQRIMGLPLALAGYGEPERDPAKWRTAEKWGLADTWFHRSGHRAESMLLLGRSTMAVLAALLGLLIWWWSRRLFGATGAMVSLGLYVLSPSFLANGPLMTSDTTCALFFLAACAAYWAMLDRLTIARVAVAAIAIAGLFLAKMSAVLFVPIAVVLVAARLVHPPPLPIGSRWVATHRRHRVLWVGAAAAVQLVVVWVAIWAAYGFRYAACKQDTPGDLWELDVWEHVLRKPPPAAIIDGLTLDPAQRERALQVLAISARGDRWTPAGRTALAEIRRTVLNAGQQAQLDRLLDEPPPRLAPATIDFARRHRLFPEAYLYGYAHALRYSQARLAFFNGDYRTTGWISFFPYTFLVKTPLPVFAVIAIAVGAFVARLRREQRGDRARSLGRALYATLPLWTLFLFYWVALLSSHLNIGHRHMLATYPPLFILCGACVSILRRPGTAPAGSVSPRARPRTVPATLLALLFLGLLVDVGWQHPHHLAYFNGIIRPRDAWKHLVDSSLDWGQDLPGLRQYLDAQPQGEPTYLSYFGTGSPRYYGIRAYLLPGFPELDRTSPVKAMPLPSDNPREVLDRYLEHHPEFDPAMVGAAQMDSVRYAILMQRPEALSVRPGTYCISATMLQLGNASSAWGRWTQVYEDAYQEIRRAAAPLVSPDVETRRSALRTRPLDETSALLLDFQELSFRRLTSWLRKRPPDEAIGWSILIYHLSNADLREALDGPPAELVSTNDSLSPP